jgi:signal transduction histidine kinase
MLTSSSKLRKPLRMNESTHGEGTASEPHDRVTELIEQQTAISEVLRAIASSPHNLQPIFDAILDSATRLCRADAGSLRLSEERDLRLVAVRGDPLMVSQAWSSFPVFEKGSFLSRLAASGLPTHVPDLTALEGDHRDDFFITVMNAGYRTALVVPLLKDNEIVGIITLGRKRAQPFTDGQISLFMDFAAQAAIALEGTRRERQFREAQMALAHANRVATMGQLTASIAHEVNQPIGSARNNARAALNFLDRSAPDLGEVREALSCIVADADRAGGIIDRIRDQIRNVPPRNGRFDLNQAIEEVIGLAQSTIIENGISVQTRLESGMAPAHGDRVQLQQVVLNLILNAVEAMSSDEVDEKQLSISTDQSEANGTLVAVRDSGPGIDPKHLELVFGAFYSTKSGGMGMGLSICRSIITAHGGRLWATATEPRGALIQFTLPRAEPASSSPNFATDLTRST